MSENKIHTTKSIEINKDNLTAILGQLILSDYVEKFEVNLFEEYITVTDSKKNDKRFDYYDRIEITKDTIRLAKENNRYYTGYWLCKSEVLKKLVYADNVTSYSVDKEHGFIYIHTEYNCSTMDIEEGVIVFDDEGDFVEVFKPDTCIFDSAMRKHGYTRVKE